MLIFSVKKDSTGSFCKVFKDRRIRNANDNACLNKKEISELPNTIAGGRGVRPNKVPEQRPGSLHKKYR